MPGRGSGGAERPLRRWRITAWDDTRLGLKHLTGWERLALVSDVEWVRWALKLFGLAIPGHIRVFHNRELAEAKQWVGE
jgi:hypothetical protein